MKCRFDTNKDSYEAMIAHFTEREKVQKLVETTTPTNQKEKVHLEIQELNPIHFLDEMQNFFETHDFFAEFVHLELLFSYILGSGNT